MDGEGNLPSGTAQLKLQPTESCGWGHHAWIDVGFRHEKLVCKVCDIEKPKEN